MINGKASEEFAASTSEFPTKSYIIILGKCKQRVESQGEGRCTCISITIEFQQCGYVLCSSILPVYSELGISKQTHFKKLKACFPPF